MSMNGSKLSHTPECLALLDSQAVIAIVEAGRRSTAQSQSSSAATSGAVRKRKCRGFLWKSVAFVYGGQECYVISAAQTKYLPLS